MTNALVTIPTYNEADNIRTIIAAVFGLDKGYHMLIVDDGSPDGTGDIVEELQDTYPDKLHLIRRTGKNGLGTAYLAAFRWALERDYTHVFEMDADFSHDPKDLPRLLEACTDKGADVAIGSRYVKGVNVVNWPMSRVLLSYFASKYVRFVTGLPVADSTAGFKCYRREVLETVKLNKIRFVGYAFQIEMKFTAWKCGFEIAEVPVIFTERKFGESKMSSGIFTEAIFGVISMKTGSWFKKYPQKK
ncbi:MAG: polyprenol monophosphomannose synthase [Flavobacteriales bacterium]|nr:polyprenol monophosphomannose synthase [Flavobacteriales bacterium]